MPTKAYTHSIYWLAKRQAARARRPHARTLTEALISDCLVPGSDRGRHVPYGSSVAAAAVIAPVAVPAVIAATLTYDIGVAAARCARVMRPDSERRLTREVHYSWQNRLHPHIIGVKPISVTQKS